MSTTVIAAEEILFHPCSFVDPNGRLFWWRGQLYRGIAPARADCYTQIFKQGLVAELVEKRLLVNTEATSYSLAPYGLVLRHQLVPFVSYGFEWCSSMFRDAALLVLDLLIELSGHDLSLQDAHPQNVLFEGVWPKWIDFGSIKPSPQIQPWDAHEEFLRRFVYPLQLMQLGYSRLAHALLFDWDVGVLPDEVAALNRRRPKSQPESPAEARSWRWRLAQKLVGRSNQITPRERATIPPEILDPPPAPGAFSNRLDYARSMRDYVESMVPPAPKTDWSNYYGETFPAFEPAENWMPKHRTVHQVLSECLPGSVLDVGSNRGWYAQLAAHRGSQVVAFDVDETCVGQLYADARHERLNILPLVMSFYKPTPAFGLQGWFPSATERFACDMVLGLALVHHLVFKTGLRFEHIASGLAAFTRKHLLVEFIPKEDRYVSQWAIDRFDWYHLDQFKTALARHFATIRLLPSNPEPRVLLLCQK